jgi:hypothetical protein
MAPFKPQFKFIGDCAPGELVRMRTGEQETSWAIYCAAQSRFVHCAAVLGAGGATAVNLYDQGQLARDFATIPVLAYGNGYAIAPDHGGPVTIMTRETPKIPGAILQAKGDYFLMTKMESGSFDYLLLDGSGKILSEPGGERAIYGRWRLVHSEIVRDGVPQSLMQFDAPSMKAGKVTTQAL